MQNPNDILNIYIYMACCHATSRDPPHPFFYNLKPHPDSYITFLKGASYSGFSPPTQILGTRGTYVFNIK